MTCTPRQSKHTNSNQKFKKDQIKTFLLRLNFLASFILEILSLCHCLCVFSPPTPQEMGIAQQATTNPEQLLSNTDGPFPFAHFLGPLFPLFGHFSFLLADPTAVPLPTPCWCLEFTPFSCF